MHCNNCGSQVVEGGRFCGNCGAETTAAPVAHMGVSNLAGVGRRTLGALIDLVVLAAIFAAFVAAFGQFETAEGNFEATLPWPPGLGYFLVWLIYFIVMEVTTGKTVGKYVVNTRVVNEAGENISWGQAIGRNLLRIIDGFFFYLVGFVAILSSRDNRRLGDMAANTYVVSQ